MAQLLSYLNNTGQTNGQVSSDGAVPQSGGNVTPTSFKGPPGSKAIINPKTHEILGWLDPVTGVYTSPDGSRSFVVPDGQGGVHTGVKPVNPGDSSGDATAESYIRQIYDQQIAANQAALENAYDLNVNTINAQRELLPETYQTAKNTTAAQAEIQKGNFNEYASAAGLSSGAGGQAQLSMSNALQGNLSALDKAQADALASLDLQMTNLSTQYQNDLAQAFAEGNLAKVAALYESYENSKAALMAQAQFDAQMQLSRDQLAQNQSQFDTTMQYNQNMQGFNIALAAAEYTGIFLRYGGLRLVSGTDRGCRAAVERRS